MRIQGWTDTAPTDPAAVAAQTALCQVRLVTLGNSCPAPDRTPPLPGLSIALGSVCSTGCASDFISFHADCRQLLQADGVPGAALHQMDMFLDSCNTAPPSPPNVPPLTTAQCT